MRCINSIFIRATAPSLVLRARISYGNSVCPSVRLGVCHISRYRSTHSWDRDFGFSAYDSLESLVFPDKFYATGGGSFSRTRASNKGTP